MSEDRFALEGERVAVPESRQLDVLCNLLEARGASVVRLPLVSILDTPDASSVEQWLQIFIKEPFDYFIILTGEGLRRLLDFADRAGCREAFVAALDSTTMISRGPKPGRVLREIGLKANILAAAPTTEGVIETLGGLELSGRRVAVQLYGEEPNLRLTDYLRERQATPVTVAPYIYAPQADEEQVADFIAHLESDRVTAMMFTSQPQYARLAAVARKRGMQTQLVQGLNRIRIVAVGPLVAAQLQEAGVSVEVMPQQSWFMKPMVTALVRALRPD